jgi:hypothetical protein
MSLLYGLVTGILFGILLQRAHVLRYDKQVGAMRLIDMTIVKFMLTAVITAAVGIYLLKDMGMISLSVKGTSLGAQIGGGIIFGIGWGLLGYCPGTAAGALGEGRFDGLWGLLGMLCGGGLYALAYPFMKANIIPIGDFGKIRLPELFGIHHWIVIVILAVGAFFLFRFFEKQNL